MDKTWLDVLVSGCFFVAVCALIFWPLEELFEGDKSNRPTLKDIASLWFYHSFGLWFSAGIIYQVAYAVRQWVPAGFRATVHTQPFWLQALEALLLAEVWVYVAHRLSHRLPFLWKFHRVHHTLVDMTWSAASRQHPVDFLLIIVGANLPALVLGIDLRPISLFVVLERLYTVLLHSNLQLDWGWFSKLIASPRLHRLHHDPDTRGNFAGILSLLDVIGRTYCPPAKTRPRCETTSDRAAL